MPPHKPTNSIIELGKRVLSERQRAFVRPIYYAVQNRARRLASPAVTPLPGNIDANPALRFRFDFFQAAQEYLQVNRIDGSYLEFGCHEANTFRMALNALGSHGKPNRITGFWAFDSFGGMPEPEGIDKQKIWRGQMNYTSEQKFRAITRRDAHRVTTVKGFYEDSLKTVELPEDQYPALTYIDCDYYSSTKQVLDWLGKVLRHGCLVAFDDWDCYFGDDERGQRKAFREFADAQRGRLEFAPFMKINSGGMSFICLETDKQGTDFEGY